MLFNMFLKKNMLFPGIKKLFSFYIVIQLKLKLNTMKHLRKVTAYRVGNKLHKTRKAAEKDAGKRRKR